ncbi:MAG TPA: energy transducer TonB, partial [Mucilaginibacter sp.]|nr:energy transducer TonB [Mucilaginibacter sp.]
VYLYRFAIKYIHEFIADRQVIERGTDKVDYALLLLSQTFETDTHNLVIPFYNHSLLKERIKMLQKNRSHRIMLAKYGLSAPLFMLMMILSSATVKNSKAVALISKKTEKALQMPAAGVIDNNSEISAENKVIDQAANAKTAATNVEFVNRADTVPGEKIFAQVERQAEFPGGLRAFDKFLGDNVKYPKADREKGVSGKVFCTFIVEKDGSLSAIKAVRGPSAAMSAEAVRVLTKSPKWKPGVQNKHLVRVAYTVPINFVISPAVTNTQPGANNIAKVYNQVSKMPEFPGGLNAFGKFLSDNVKYPKADRENGVSGKVFCTFIVEMNGALSDIKANRGPSATMSAEAVRVLALSPKWQPGLDDIGKPVRVSYTVPINFTLETDDGKPNGLLDSLRGKTNVNGKHSLYIVDDVRYKPSEKLPNIKQDDIKLMQVFTGETAVKLYGDAGKDGVIVITTKKKK